MCLKFMQVCVHTKERWRTARVFYLFLEENKALCSHKENMRKEESKDHGGLIKINI